MVVIGVYMPSTGLPDSAFNHVLRRLDKLLQDPLLDGVD
eukprot:COSAG02_NODE_1882_length_10539_cov_56.252203_1_plen_38_part_10